MENISASKRNLIVASIMTVMFLAAIENMITSTILPSVISSVGGLSLYPWVASMFMLTSTITIPLYGKLSDIYGHKIFTLFAIAIFLFGSVLCGLAQSMVQLIIFRAVQGIGAGGLITMSFILFGLIFPKEKRAQMQGLLTSVWAIASIAGPVIGAFCVEVLNWRWAFFINIPFGLIAAGLLTVFYKEGHEKPVSHKIDYLGVVLFASGVFIFLYSLLDINQHGLIMMNFALLVIGIALITALVIHETRVEEPIMPVKQFKNRVFTVSVMLNFVAAAGLFSAINFIPLFIQGVLGEAAKNAGQALTLLSLGWVSGSLLCGRVLNRLSLRLLITAATFIMISGFFLLTKVGQDTSLITLTLLCFLPGFGMGILATGTLVTVQISAPKAEIGAATSGVQLFRSIGGTMGVTILGGIQVGILKNLLAEKIASSPGSKLAEIAAKPHLLLDEVTRHTIPADVLRELSGYLSVSINRVFVIAFFISILGFFIARFLPDKKGISV